MNQFRKKLKLLGLGILIVLVSVGVGIGGGIAIPSFRRKEDTVEVKVELVEKEKPGEDGEHADFK